MAKGKAARRAARPDDLVTLTRDARDYLDELDRRAKCGTADDCCGRCCTAADPADDLAMDEIAARSA